MGKLGVGEGVYIHIHKGPCWKPCWLGGKQLIIMTYQFWHTYFGTIKKTSHFKALLHFHHALYNTGIVLIVFVSLRAFI